MTTHAPAFSVCPRCGGTGYVPDQRQRFAACPTCDRVGVLGATDAGYVVWTADLDTTALWRSQLRALLRGGVSVVLLFLGVVGLVAGGLAVARLVQEGAPPLDFLNETGNATLVFWLSLTGNLYGYYRLRDDARVPHVLPRLQPLAEASEFTAARADSARFIAVERYLAPDGQRVVERAWRTARRFQHPTVEPVHLFTALLQEPVILGMVVRLGIPSQKLSAGLARQLGALSHVSGQPPRVSGTTQELLLTAAVESSERQRVRIGIPELFASFAHIPEPVADLLDALGVDSETLENVVEWLAINETLARQAHHLAARASLKPKGTMDRAMTAVATPHLDRMGRDLTAQARVGNLPYCVNREREIAATFRALQGGHRAVILVGEPGVGKTAVLYGIAERMAAEEVPSVIQDKRLIQLSVTQLVGGGGGAGDLEARFLGVLEEVSRAGNIVLAIENLHTLIGVTSSGGNLDLSEVLGQAVQRGGLTVFGTTTPASYRKYVEESGSLLSAFERVEVEETDPLATLHILQAKVAGLESKTGLVFSYEALTKAVDLSRRYLHERFLPEKAVSLLDEVAVSVRARGRGRLITGEDIAALVSERGKVKVTAVTEDESQKLLHLEEQMHQRMVGQDEAVTAVAGALRRARAGLRDEKRPIASFLFLGPTGVGKTELAKTVAEVYFGDENSMVRLDMSEYQDGASIRRLLGSPPGSGTEHGYLTEAVRARPFVLVLLDELEKAHPDILNVFLQVMDDGRMTDNLGRTVDFTNVILIATSNAGTPLIQQRISEGLDVPRIKEELVRGGTLAQYFRPEFLNRFDGIIVFRSLIPGEIEQIVGLMLARIAAGLEARGIRFQASPDAVRNLAAQGFDPLFGARPLRRLIQETVDNALAQYLLTGHLGRRDTAVLEADGSIRVEAATVV